MKKTKFNQAQLDLIDVMIGNLLDARETHDTDEMQFWTTKLYLFLSEAKNVQDARAKAEKQSSDTRYIVLESYGTKKIGVIKALRKCVPGLGLKEAKTIVESAPIGLSREIPGITDVLGQLHEAGADVRTVNQEPQYIAAEVRAYFDQVERSDDY